MLTLVLAQTLAAQLAVTPMTQTVSHAPMTLRADTAFNTYQLPEQPTTAADLRSLARLDLNLTDPSPLPSNWNERARTSYLSYQDEASDSGPSDVNDNTQAIEPSATTIAYGTQGQLRWTFQGAWSISVKDSADQSGLLGFAFDYFFIDNLSVNAEFNGIFVDQVGPNAWGFNFNLIARWHIIAQENWSFFVDGGAGLDWTTQNVPDTGSKFNFTPQAGVGFTVGVGGNARVITGVRWLHISNANLYPENPGRDSIEVYAGITFPF